jgi:hypothetical protein
MDALPTDPTSLINYSFIIIHHNPYTRILWKTLCEDTITNPAMIAPMKFLIVIVISGELASRESPDIVYKLSTNQNASVIHPIIPAVMAPNLAPLLTKNIENTILIYHKPLKISQFTLSISGRASST